MNADFFLLLSRRRSCLGGGGSDTDKDLKLLQLEFVCQFGAGKEVGGCCCSGVGCCGWAWWLPFGVGMALGTEHVG